MSDLKLYNTMSRKKEVFEPLNPPDVKLYTCGPTVYNYAHIGNLRTYVFEDLLRRVLEWNGYVVEHVMNITDVGHLTSDADDGEDKMLKGAQREHKTVWEIAEFYTQAFFEDLAKLNIEMPTIKPKATDHIQDMINQIKQLEKNGMTYVANGNVYFDTSKLSDYGKLAKLERQDLKAGARIEVDKNKKNPYDFVLWFTKSKFEDQAMQWESPWGKGYPGWHIECSAMSQKYLGKQMDIHCGGIDHIPVHHTNEIAQSEGATGEKHWVKYWMHGNFLVLGKNEKMAKSANNFLRLQTLIDKGYSPLDYRYFCLQSHYRKELTFSWEGMDAAHNALTNLYRKLSSYIPLYYEGMDFYNLAEEGKRDPLYNLYCNRFVDAINDDLNIPEALSVFWDALKHINTTENKTSALRVAIISEFDKILGLNILENGRRYLENIIPENIEKLILERDVARKEKNWQKSDELRAEIEKAGFIVKDGPKGTEVQPK